MICKVCGRHNVDNAAFCADCGAPLTNAQQPEVSYEETQVLNSEQTTVVSPEQPVQQTVYQQQPEQPPVQQPVYQQPIYQQPVYQQPVYQQPVYQQPVYQQPVYQQPVYQQPVYQQPVYQSSGTPIIGILRHRLSSTLALVAAILYSVSFVFSFVFTSATDINGISYTLSSGNIIAVLIVIGFWLIYASAKQPKPLSIGGFKCIKAYSIITIVAFSIAAGCVLILLALGATAAELISEYSDEIPGFSQYIDSFSDIIGNNFAGSVAGGVVAGVLILVGLIAMLAFAFGIIYMAFVNKQLNGFINVLNGKNQDLKINMFVVVILIIAASFSAISGLASIFTSFMAGITMLCSSAATALIAAILLGIRSDLKQIPTQQSTQIAQ